MGYKGYEDDIGGISIREFLHDEIVDFLSERVQALVNESVEAWFKENKEAMQEAIRVRLGELCEQHVKEALYGRVARAAVKFMHGLEEEFERRLRDEAEGVMKGHWNDIKARFIQAIHDGERIEAVPFGL